MTNEETSAYLLMTAGMFWVFIGIIGSMRQSAQAPSVQDGRDEDDA